MDPKPPKQCRTTEVSYIYSSVTKMLSCSYDSIRSIYWSANEFMDINKREFEFIRTHFKPHATQKISKNFVYKIIQLQIQK